MAIETTTTNAPAHWACYLINGDASGFDYYNTPSDNAGDRDKAECDAWLDKISAEGWHVTLDNDAEPFFDRWRGLGTDLLTYTLYRQL